MSPLRRKAVRIIATLKRLSPEVRRRVFEGLPQAVAVAVAEEWWWQARGGQKEPRACADGSPWRVWTIMAGRGFGKTRAGAEWVWARARGEGDTGDSLSGCPLRDSLSGCPLPPPPWDSPGTAYLAVPFPPPPWDSPGTAYLAVPFQPPPWDSQ